MVFLAGVDSEFKTHVAKSCISNDYFLLSNVFPLENMKKCVNNAIFAFSHGT